MKAIRAILPGLLALIVVSCADQKAAGGSGSGRPTQAPGMKEKSFDSWATSMGEGGYKQDADGHWGPQEGSRRSIFESQDRDSPYFKGKFAGTDRQFKTGEYAKKSWWGNKEFQHKEYAGNTDGSRFQTESMFGAKKARDASKVPWDAGKSARESGGAFATTEAREAGSRRLDRPSDAETESRRKVFTPPSVISWDEQRALNMRETKSILGKD